MAKYMQTIKLGEAKNSLFPMGYGLGKLLHNNIMLFINYMYLAVSHRNTRGRESIPSNTRLDRGIDNNAHVSKQLPCR